MQQSQNEELTSLLELAHKVKLISRQGTFLILMRKSICILAWRKYSQTALKESNNLLVLYVPHLLRCSNTLRETQRQLIFSCSCFRILLDVRHIFFWQIIVLILISCSSSMSLQSLLVVMVVSFMDLYWSARFWTAPFLKWAGSPLLKQAGSSLLSPCWCWMFYRHLIGFVHYISEILDSRDLPASAFWVAS